MLRMPKLTATLEAQCPGPEPARAAEQKRCSLLSMLLKIRGCQEGKKSGENEKVNGAELREDIPLDLSVQRMHSRCKVSVAWPVGRRTPAAQAQSTVVAVRQQ